MLTLSPDRLTALAACNTSSASRPATKRRESFWPSEERSARRRSDLLSERLMKKARSTVEKENLNFYHSCELGAPLPARPPRRARGQSRASLVCAANPPLKWRA